MYTTSHSFWLILPCLAPQVSSNIYFHASIIAMYKSSLRAPDFSLLRSPCIRPIRTAKTPRLDCPSARTRSVCNQHRESRIGVRCLDRAHLVIPQSAAYQSHPANIDPPINCSVESNTPAQLAIMWDLLCYSIMCRIADIVWQTYVDLLVLRLCGAHNASSH